MDDSLNGTAGRELISFHIGSQEFCLDVMDIREIRGWTPATPMPHAPSFVCGVINLRGSVMPVIDVAARLGLGAVTEPTSRHVTIVVRTGSRFAGLLVDAVSETFTVAQSEIQAPPRMAGMAANSVEGLLIMDGRMLSLLSLDFLIPSESLVEAA